jgi:aspartate-semialdehyde dehydrogenase
MEPIPVAILGATGMVGQRMVEALVRHPFFHVTALTGSERSAGKTYGDAATWRLAGDCPSAVTDWIVRPTTPDAMPGGTRIVFSALDSAVAGPIEDSFRDAGFAVVSNASNHRMDTDVPLVIPEVNPEHLALVERQRAEGFIVTNPNCSIVPLAMALAPLHARWPVEAATVATYQAVSGAGYPGESAWDMVGSVHPHPGNEEDKVAIEAQKILGSVDSAATFAVSARCVRVPVADGHMIAAHVRLRGDPSPEDAKAAMREWTGKAPELPSSPRPLLVVTERRDRPSTRFDVDRGNGMACTVGRVERCAVMGLKFFVLGHNTIRGAAGAAIANAELLAVTGRLG